MHKTRKALGRQHIPDKDIAPSGCLQDGQALRNLPLHRLATVQNW